MPAKRKAGGRKRKAGKGFFDFIKKVGSKIGDLGKNAVGKVIEKAAPIAVGGLIRAGVPGGQIIAPALGLGRRRHRGGMKMAGPVRTMEIRPLQPRTFHMPGQGGRGNMTSEQVKVLAF